MARRSAPPAVVQVVDSAPADSIAFEGHVQGSDSAPVTVVEYADFVCPACAQFAIYTMEDARRRLIQTGQVRWVFRDFPLNIHPNAMAAHLAAACAGEQGRFWEMHDQLYFNHGRWVREARPERRLRDFARDLGLDLSAYDRCVADAGIRARIEASARDAAERGIGSTPTFDVGTRRVSGILLFDSLRTLVERAMPRPP
jgi:protein-disulfide isomerase